MSEGSGWPLVGREAELGEIEAALASQRRPAGLVLVGAVGVGKTRLIREALIRWTEAGGAAEWAMTTPAAASVPFGALSHLLPAGSHPDPSSVALFARLSSWFVERAHAGPVVVGVDDGHLLDDASAGLLHQLAGRNVVVPLLTLRSDAHVGDAMVALCKDHVRRLQVRPLPPTAVDRLLDEVLDGHLDPISRRQLHRLVDGNPLLLRELLADATEDRSLARRDGIWCWYGPVPAHARLEVLVAARLRGVEPAARAVLEIIACAESVAPELLLQMADADAVEAAERSDIAVAQTVGARTSLRLAHPLYAEVLRGRLPVTRARNIWTALAAALAKGLCRRRDDMFTIAVWQLRSGRIHEPDLVAAAAEEAVARFDLGLAERLARAARGAGSNWEADWQLARILQRRGRYGEAADVLPDAPETPGERHTRWTVTRASALYWGSGSAHEAARALAAAEPDRGGTRARLAWIRLLDGRCTAAHELSCGVLALPDASGPATTSAATTGAVAAGLLGRLDEALTVAARGRSVAARTGRSPWNDAQAEVGRCLALLSAGRISAAAHVAEDGYRLAVECEARPILGIWSAFRGLVAKARGRPADAQACLREAVALLDDDDPYQLVPVWLAETAGAAALAGDLATAGEFMARADARWGRANRLLAAWVERNRAWVEAASGALTAAAKLSSGAAAHARDTEQPTTEALCLYDAARFGAAATVRSRLAKLAAHAEGPLLPALATAAAALATGDAAALDKAATVFVDHEHLLLAAEAATAAAGSYRRDGLITHARIASERAAVLAHRCPGARTALLKSDRLVAVLTPREREVALLAVSLPSRQIAQRLRLSVHTVNNNLARAFAKLGVAGRGQLAEILGDRAEPSETPSRQRPW